MLLRFIGTNGSLCLIHGGVYDCDITTQGNHIWVSWNNGQSACPYESIMRLAENWEIARSYQAYRYTNKGVIK